MDDGTALLRLASVCRHWKDAAFCHPQLWTSLRCELPRTDSEACMTHFVGQLQGWFGRAGDLPLSLAISFHSWSRGSEKPFSEFLAGCSRWESLQFEDHRMHQILLYEWMVKIAEAGKRVSAREGRKACWPGLRSLEINAESHDVYYSIEHDLPIRALAPRLQQFTARYSNMPYSPLFQTLDGVPLTHLSDLTLHGIEDSPQSLQFLSRFLDHAPSLESLEVFHCNPDSLTDLSPYLPRHNATIPTTHSRLQRLSLRSPIPFVTHLFYRTRLPAIRVLLLNVPPHLEVIVPALHDNYHRSDLWPFLSSFSFGPSHVAPLELVEGDADFQALMKFGPSGVDFLTDVSTFITRLLGPARPRRPL